MSCGDMIDKGLSSPLNEFLTYDQQKKYPGKSDANGIHRNHPGERG